MLKFQVKRFCPDHITVQIHKDQPLLFESLFKETTDEAIAVALYPSHIVEHLGIQTPAISQGDSGEEHKEFRDNEAIRTLLVSLSGDSVGKPILYGEEVYFNMA